MFVTKAFRIVLLLWASCDCRRFSRILPMILLVVPDVADAFTTTTTTTTFPSKPCFVLGGECHQANGEDLRQRPPRRHRQGQRILTLLQLETTTTTTSTTTNTAETEGRKVDGDPTTTATTTLVIKTKHDKQWLQKFNDLKEFQRVHGNCNVPKDSKGHIGSSLPKWISSQRRAFKLGQMRDDRKELLDNIGFIWDPQNEAWQTNYEELKAYKGQHGHCNVPRRQGRLGNWVERQRQMFHSKQMTKERRDLLEKIGFVWDPLDEIWQNTYKELQQFQQLHGHVNVPEETLLSAWTVKQRLDHAAGRLDTTKKMMLDGLGFAWEDPDFERHERQWLERFYLLESYKHLEGHVNVPVNKSPLGQWVMTQRKFYHEGRLLPHRREKLDSIGFVWRLRETTNLDTTTWDKKWMKKYEALKEFKEDHGHANYPLKENSLGFWVQRQRRLFSKDKLREDRKALLEEIGFQWELDKISSHERWQAKYAELDSYKMEFGNVNVSQVENSSLYNWIRRQRILQQAGRLGSKRKARLDKLGMEW